MVQRKVPNKPSIQTQHVIKSDKFSTNMKLSSSSSSSSSSSHHQNHDEKTKLSKKMKKSNSTKLSHLETLQLQTTPLSRKTTTTTKDVSPNYMKPTSSSQSKKELFHVSLRKTQSCSVSKNLATKFSSDYSCKKPSLSLVRTLTKTTSFKGSRNSPRKSTRATCSSTLKDSNFPSYLELNHGGTELEGSSVMRVCSYSYCSLNGHHHHHGDNLPPLKTFVASRRRVLKRVKLEALSPRSPRSRRLKAMCEVGKKDCDVEQNVFDEKPECDEIDMDFFLEIYASERKDEKSEGEEEIGKVEFLEEVEGCEDIIKSTIEDDGVEADFMKEVKDQEKREDADEEEQSSWSHEEMSMEDVDNNTDDSDSERFYGFDQEHDADSSVYADEENDSKDESLSQSSHDVSVTWLDDIISSYYDDIILLDGSLKESKSEEIIYLEEESHDGMISFVLDDKIGSNETQEIGYPTTDVECDRSSLADETFEYLTNSEEKVQENEDFKRGEKNQIQSSPNEFELCPLKLTVTDETLNVDVITHGQEDHIPLVDVVEESIKDIQNQGRGNKRASCIVHEEENVRESRKGVIRRKMCVDDDDEMRKFNPRDPNFLPLVPEKEKEKVDLRHQMMDERKNAEDWMVDCALRQVVNKLAPARKKKVALLVEAFETVIPKCESHLRNNSRFVHAC
ncbi:calmodulin binding protein PICBP [Vicia villosa]|uniref:calmodulin binding protein PICBP n=1 Tax=Vicia villosa TaxID=3911 RepID=UPI00273C99A1|nr:calmodulin binding protein PICBP [Vicia villosa]XP_058758671.1 calmodulin binding protein PICBP [Vicia villosa]